MCGVLAVGAIIVTASPLLGTPINNGLAFVRSGPVGFLDWDSLENGPRAGFVEFQTEVGVAVDAITVFEKRVVVSRRDFAVQNWRGWILEDLLCILIGGCGRIWSLFWSMIQISRLVVLVSLLCLMQLMSNSDVLGCLSFFAEETGVMLIWKPLAQFLKNFLPKLATCCVKWFKL